MEIMSALTKKDWEKPRLLVLGVASDLIQTNKAVGYHDNSGLVDLNGNALECPYGWIKGSDGTCTKNP